MAHDFQQSNRTMEAVNLLSLLYQYHQYWNKGITYIITTGHS